MYFFIKIKLQHCVLYYNFIVTSFFIIMFDFWGYKSSQGAHGRSFSTLQIQYVL
jgi:hypothetical protein